MEMHGVGLASIFPIFPSIFPHHPPSTLEIVTARAPPSLCWNNPCRIDRASAALGNVYL
jgi:hypothetical protein